MVMEDNAAADGILLAYQRIPGMIQEGRSWGGEPVRERGELVECQTGHMQEHQNE